jgi:hypothetical protein
MASFVSGKEIKKYPRVECFKQCSQWSDFNGSMVSGVS